MSYPRRSAAERLECILSAYDALAQGDVELARQALEEARATPEEDTQPGPVRLRLVTPQRRSEEPRNTESVSPALNFVRVSRS